MFRTFGLAFVALFVALDIIGTLPMYVSMTHGLTPKKRGHTVDTSMLVALIVALVFVFAGDHVFSYLNIAIFDFKIAGGLILLLVSLADLLNQAEMKSRASGSTGIVPLAVPLITGPGVITTLVLQVSTLGYAVTVASLLANYAIGWFLLRKSETITGWIGRDGTVVVSKIAALLLAAIAVAMIRTGIFEAVHAGGR